MKAPSEPTAPGIALAQARLLDWYRANRRDLPWRRTRDPYAIWISEAMLQQTRVEAVLGYWRRFLDRFPDVASLARAGDEQLLAAWSGLGYYRRARSLREAARAVVARHGGEFPSDRESALALPGIGPYTAGAVLSIAFDAREALVDGNVARVLSRWFALEDALGSAVSQRRTWQLARELLPAQGGAGEWNQALMELGATVCTAARPRCGDCPLSDACAALALGRVGELPRPKPRPSVLEVEVEVLLVRRGDAVLLEQRPADAARMAGLWELPTRESGVPSGLFRATWFPEGRLHPGAELARLRHTITRHRIRVVAREARLAPGADLAPGWRWIEVGRAGEHGLTGMAKKVLARCPATGSAPAAEGRARRAAAGA